MKPRIETIEEKKLVGVSMRMSLANYRIGELWRSFLPKRSMVSNTLTEDLISLVVYAPNHFRDFKPSNEFERWAVVEVSDYEQVPSEMKTFDLQGGLYAVFEYKGLNTDHAVFQYIYGSWLPSSDFELDNRPHFEILGERYKNNDPESEEEIWIPIRRK